VAGRQHYLAPGRPAEHVLARLWAELLGLDQVGVEDNFFDLGGDSFRAIQMVARAEEAGLKLTLTDVLEHQTIAGLATLAESQQAPGSAGQPADHVDSRSDLGLPAGPRTHRGGGQLARPRSA
jgi:aryl carrier-like protein